MLVKPWVLVAFAASLAAQEFPEATITNGIITAKLYLPDGARGYYRGTRFDWSGQIASLQYKGHEYFGKWFERYDPKGHDAIMGPVEEFVAGESSVGYDDASAGSKFVRIGVGAVRKPEEKGYQRFHTYEIVDGGKWSVKPGRDRVQFVHDLADAGGYAYRYTKVVRLEKDRPEMAIDHVLENRGTKPIRTSQYNHNFFMLDGQPTGPATTVEFPFTLEPVAPVRGDAARVEGGRIVYVRELKAGESFFGEFRGTGPSANLYEFRVGNTKTGTAVRVTGDRPLSKLVFWSIPATFCPEPYIDLDIAAGKEARWTYRYEFSAK